MQQLKTTTVQIERQQAFAGKGKNQSAKSGFQLRMKNSNVLAPSLFRHFLRSGFLSSAGESRPLPYG